MSTTSITSYEEAVANHEWHVPERYNIAEDVCDKHPADKLAMIHEHFDGTVRRVAVGRAAGALEPVRERAARARRREGRPCRDAAARRRPRPRPRSSARGSAARSCSRCRCSTATTASATASATRRPRSSSPTRRTRTASIRRWSSTCCCSTTSCCSPGDAAFEREDTLAEDPAQLYYTSRHDRAGQGHRARAPLPARARGVHLLPRRARRRGLPRHGRVGVGGGHRAAARAVALRRRPARLPARGRLRPAQAARLALPPRGDRTSSRRRPRCAR